MRWTILPAVLACACVPGLAFAESGDERIRPGQRIRFTLPVLDGDQFRSVDGRLVAADAKTVVLRTRRGEATFARRDIANLEVAEAISRRRAAWQGAKKGAMGTALVWLGFLLAVSSGGDREAGVGVWLYTAPVVAAAGGAVGAAAGAASAVTWRRADTSALAVSVAPSANGGAVRFRLRF